MGGLAPDGVFAPYSPTVIPKDAGVSVMLAERANASIASIADRPKRSGIRVDQKIPWCAPASDPKLMVVMRVDALLHGNWPRTVLADVWGANSYSTPKSGLNWNSHPTGGKQAVLGMRERGGRVKAKPVETASQATASQATITEAINESVAAGSTIYTDGSSIYSPVDGVLYEHESVNHGAGEYVRGKVHTNGMESVWAVLKRGYNGVYHGWSKKHTQAYVDEFTFRLNEGSCEIDTQDRPDALFYRVRFQLPVHCPEHSCDPFSRRILSSAANARMCFISPESLLLRCKGLVSLIPSRSSSAKARGNCSRVPQTIRT